MAEPSEGQIRIQVRVSAVGPTDLKIRRGALDGVFPLPEPAVLGFETAGVVDAIGSEVIGVAVGDEVAAWLPSLGGYGEYALAAAWTPKSPNVSWSDAGALPASVEAAKVDLRLAMDAIPTIVWSHSPDGSRPGPTLVTMTRSSG